MVSGRESISVGGHGSNLYRLLDPEAAKRAETELTKNVKFAEGLLLDSITRVRGWNGVTQPSSTKLAKQVAHEFVVMLSSELRFELMIKFSNEKSEELKRLMDSYSKSYSDPLPTKLSKEIVAESQKFTSEATRIFGPKEWHEQFIKALGKSIRRETILDYTKPQDTVQKILSEEVEYNEIEWETVTKDHPISGAYMPVTPLNISAQIAAKKSVDRILKEKSEGIETARQLSDDKSAGFSKLKSFCDNKFIAPFAQELVKAVKEEAAKALIEKRN